MKIVKKARGIYRIRVTAMMILLLLLCRECLDPFPLPDVSEGLLVVDARFTDQVEKNRIILSFAGQVNEGGVPVSGAIVYVQDLRGNTYNFMDSGMGIYLPEDDECRGTADEEYVLQINLGDGRSYRSDTCLFIEVPPIEELSWVLAERSSENNTDLLKGVDIRLSTSDPENRVRHYLWCYEETWEVRVPYPVMEEYIGDGHESSDFMRLDYSWECYLQAHSGDIMIKSTADQDEARIENFPFTFVSNESSRLWRQYRIDVMQFALDEEAWIYHSRLREITSQNGSVFDEQPYSLEGNISRLDDPDEVVMGYFLVSGVSSRSIDISTWDLPVEYRGDYPLYLNCYYRADTFALNQYTNIRNVIDRVAPRRNEIFVSSVWSEPLMGEPELIGLLLVPIECASCEGTQEEPENWPLTK